MRALTISKHGGLEQLVLRQDLPLPDLGAPTDVRIRVKAAAINRLDLFVLAGLPGVTVVGPWVVGSDACGEVDAIGPDVTTVSPGELVVVNPGISDRSCGYCRAGEHSLCIKYRILGEHVPGTAAEYIVVPAANVRSIPRGTDPASAAAFTLATLTAWRMVHTRARVQVGERVLIWGIGGGVALAALQVCKQIGAEVWVASSSDSKLDRARDLGADHVLRTGDDVGKRIREATGKVGMDVVIDNVGKATWTQSLMALGKSGRLVTCGATSGPVVETDVRRLFWNQWNILGSTMGNDTEFDAIVAELRAGRLLPVVDSVWPLEQGGRAYERLASGSQFGKVVIGIA
ncbi:MAG TPA: zinc-binding dehydrogenase [Gemmatimonadaceae bacterium]|nr:zinc-binding dehydrogenase [Gemmatimonadaceae bacterium]